MAKRKKGQAAVKKGAERLKVLKVSDVALRSLCPNTYNSNRQSDYDFELLCRSIIEDGYTQPIVVQEDSSEIIDGEHRWTAMIVLSKLAQDYDLVKVAKGEEEIKPKLFAELRSRRLEVLEEVGDCEITVVKTSMTREQMRIATLRHNRARGEEDIELTAQIIRDLQELGALEWAQDSLQMSDEEINRMIEDIDVPEALMADDFSESWEPEQRRPGAGADTAEGQTDMTSSGKTTSASTPAAIEERRNAQDAINAAKTEEERDNLKRERDRLHRLNLVLSGDEAELADEILGRYPGKVLIQILRYVKENDLLGNFDIQE